MVILDHAGEIGVAWARASELGAAARLHGLGNLRIVHVQRCRGHNRGPLGPLGVADLDGDGAANRLSVEDAGEQRELILFKLHTRAAAITQTTAGQLQGNLFFSDGNASGHVLNHRDERLAVGFSGSSPTKHADYYRTTRGHMLALGRQSL